MASPAPGGNGPTPRGVFEQSLEEFKKELKPKDLQLFEKSTLKELLEEIDGLQKNQNTSRRLQAVGRLKPTLEAITQLGKVIEVFANSSEYVAYIWGPMKFLLQTASQFVDAFNELLDVYEELGESLLVISQYEKHFYRDQQMRRVLGYLYKDILEFHRRALKFFHQPLWRQLFQATWKTHKSRFEKIIQDIGRHCSLVKSQATISQMQATETERVAQASQLQSILDNLESGRRKLEEQERSEMQGRERRLYCWLETANMKNEQEYFSDTRNAYPGSGRWLLENTTFKSWFEPSSQIAPPLLWLNGMPGAGKTILASLIIEELQRMPTKPAVLYFYCKQGDNERDNFGSICRSLLSQLLAFNKEMLLPLYFEKFSDSIEPLLTTQSIMKDLLATAIRNCPCAYIVLDGIDECPRQERVLISKWFRTVVENEPTSTICQIRLLFVSQDDGFARKDFDGLTKLQVRVEDSNKDIRHFSSKLAMDIQTKFELVKKEREVVESKIQEAAGGMFLLAKLIATNLLRQPTRAKLEYEMASQQLPRELNAAYTRIMARIFSEATGAEQEESRGLLSWLVCAKRPLRWHEIQAAKSIHPDSHSVDFAQLEFKVGSKDLCGSLIEIRPDMTVELIHTTAREFLIKEEHVCEPRTEMDLAQLCVNYLNFPGLTKHAPADIQQLIFDGYYVFMEYAVVYWVRHLESALSITKPIEHSRTRDLVESLETFMEHHFLPRDKVLPLSQGNERRLRKLQGVMDASLFPQFQQAVISMRKQLTFYGEIKSTDLVLDLSNVVSKVREVLEQLLSPTSPPKGTERVAELYGSGLFRCDRLSCRFFSSGFSTKEERDKHLDKHTRPFLCTVTGCPTAVIGCSSRRDLANHTTSSHPGATPHYDTDDYPDSEDAASQPSTRSSSAGSNTDPELPEKPIPKAKLAPRKRVKKTHTCQHCQKIFTRKFNYNSHLLTHGIYPEKYWKCKDCDMSFPRKSDFTRHELGHDDSRRFKCGDGSWGCGKSFARLDTLDSHHKSRKGQLCFAGFKAKEYGSSPVPDTGSQTS